MLRVVADANVLVSAAIARSPQAPSVLTLDAALDGRVELVISPMLLREVTMVLARPRLKKYVSPDEAARFVADLAAQTTLVVDAPGPHPAVCRDPRDDYLVALAEASEAEAIVSGDLDLLAIDPGQIHVEIITPRQFVEGLGKGRSA
jgi:putative PIN family toxin of toxin-antitoxin system